MMDVSPTIVAAPAAHLADEPAPPLPAMVAGDRPRVAWRDHGLRGVLFYGFAYLTSVALGFSAVMMTLTTLLNGYGGGSLALAAACGVGAVLQWRVARAVSWFMPWGWYAAMMELGAASAAKLWYVAQGQVGAGLWGLALDAWMMRYFWKRRAHFDVDLGG